MFSFFLWRQQILLATFLAMTSTVVLFSSAQIMYYTPNTCNFGTAPTNGRVGTCTRKINSSTTCLVSCSNGYKRIGTSTCDSTGAITQTATCNEVVIPQPTVCPILCPTGKYFDRLADGEDATKTVTDCKNCPEGYYQPGIFTFTCLSCSPGQYLNSSRGRSCTKCPTGYFQDGYSQIGCTGCPKGYAAGYVETVACTQCAAGQYALNDTLSFCKYCKQGQYKKPLATAVTASSDGGRRRTTQITQTIYDPKRLTITRSDAVRIMKRAKDEDRQKSLVSVSSKRKGRILGGDKKEEGATCTENGDCDSNSCVTSFCQADEGGGGGSLAEGADCTVNGDCVSNICDGTCQAEAGTGEGGSKAADGADCTAAEDCVSNICETGTCQAEAGTGEGGSKAANGEACADPSDCDSNNCVTRQCAAAEGGGAKTCANSMGGGPFDCSSYANDIGGSPAAINCADQDNGCTDTECCTVVPGGGEGGGEGGGSCTVNPECNSDNCVTGSCATKVGNTCAVDHECNEGQRCHKGVCTLTQISCWENAQGAECFNQITDMQSGSTSSTFYTINDMTGEHDKTNCACVCYPGYKSIAPELNCNGFTGSGRTCNTNNDCPTNEICQTGEKASGTCRTRQCWGDEDCGSGQTCSVQASNANDPASNIDNSGGTRRRLHSRQLLQGYMDEGGAEAESANGICQSQADLGPPVNCIGEWFPEICVKVPDSPYEDRDCEQEFVITTPDSNGGSCSNENGVRPCFRDACAVIGCDNVRGSGKTYDLLNDCGGSCTAAEGCAPEAGCDGVLGSGIFYDICGECGGDGKSCLAAAATTTVTSDFACSLCEAGTSHNELGRSNCDTCGAGKFSLAGSTGCTDCAKGQYRKATDDGYKCKGCDGGRYTNEKGQPFCLKCALGKYFGLSGASECKSCDSGRYTDVASTKRCKTCEYPEEEKPNAGKTSCERGGWKVAEDCGDNEYLGIAKEQKKYGQEHPLFGNTTCLSCPPGAWCADAMNLTHTHSYGNISFSGAQVSIWSKPGVKPMYGWARCQKRGEYTAEELTNWVPRFQACKNPQACRGAPNPVFNGKVKDEEACQEMDKGTGFPVNKNCQQDRTENVPCRLNPLGKGYLTDKLDCKKVTGPWYVDWSTLNQPEGCFVGYANHSTNQLCGRCAPGFSRVGNSCDKCPNEEQNRGIIIAGIILGIIGTFIYIRVTLAGAKESADKVAEQDHTKRDDQSIANGVKSIGLTYLQMMTLLSSYPIAWPTIFTRIFQVGGAVSALSESVVNIKCAAPEMTEADVFYYKGAGWAFLPIVLVGVCELCWLFVGCQPFFKVTHLVRNMKATAVALLYFIYPDLCTNTLAMFSCTDVCGKQMLTADLDAECWKGPHMTFILTVGIPMVVVYVVGLPLMAFVAIERIGIRANKQGKVMSEMVDDHFVFGLFYSMFKADTWWWELTIAGRKVALATIGVFGATLGLMQVHLTMALVVFIILLTAMIEPYGDEPGKPELHILELVALVFVWLTLWAGSIFNTYPNCLSNDPTDPPGTELEWCNALSLTVGVLDGLCFFVIAVAFIYLSASPNIQKKLRSCWNALIYIFCCGICCHKNHVTKDQKKQMQDIFKSFDLDGSGSIDEDELIAAMHELDLKDSKTDDEIKQMFRETDKDNSGELDFNEFMKLMTLEKNTQLITEAKNKADSNARKNLFVSTTPAPVPMRDQGKLIKHHHHHHHHHHFYGEDDQLLETKTAKAKAIVIGGDGELNATDDGSGNGNENEDDGIPLNARQRKSIFNLMALTPTDAAADIENEDTIDSDVAFRGSNGIELTSISLGPREIIDEKGVEIGVDANDHDYILENEEVKSSGSEPMSSDDETFTIL